MENLGFLIKPLIIAFICLEAVLSLLNCLHEYKVKDTLANICIGSLSWIMNIFLKGFIFLILVQVQDLSLFQFGTSVPVWIILFLVSDFFHYGFHYLEHRSRFFWANHSMHHSSEQFNFSVALRAPLINTGYRFFYEVPLCLLGFDPGMVLLVHTIMLAYAFFQHTELVKKLGWLEYILNTPSHHRVHHSSDEKYLDKNFGCVLIIWDKMFGTFHREEEHPNYGLTKPIKTYNPFKIVFHEWMAIFRDVIRSASWKEKILFIFHKPGWLPKQEKKISLQTGNPKKIKCKKCAQCSPDCLLRLKNIEAALKVA